MKDLKPKATTQRILTIKYCLETFALSLNKMMNNIRKSKAMKNNKFT